MKMNVTFIFAVALISDALDYVLMPITWLPIIGDILDVITMMILYKYIGIYAMASTIELIPLADGLPAHTAGVIIWYMKTGSKRLD